MELVFVPHRRGAAFEIADGGTFIGNDQRPLELAGARAVDAEVGRQLHRAANAFRDVAERPVREDGRVERGEKVVGVRNDRSQVLANQIRMVLNRVRERTEDDTDLRQLGAERRGHRDRVEDRIDGDARKALLLVERDAQLGKCGAHLRIDLVERVQFLLLLRRRVVNDGLVIDWTVLHVGPRRLFHRRPVTKGLEAKIKHPLRLFFLRRDESDDVFIQPGRRLIGFDVADEAVLVFLTGNLFDRAAHDFLRFIVGSQLSRTTSACRSALPA